MTVRITARSEAVWIFFAALCHPGQVTEPLHRPVSSPTGWEIIVPLSQRDGEGNGLRIASATKQPSVSASCGGGFVIRVVSLDFVSYTASIIRSTCK